MGNRASVYQPETCVPYEEGYPFIPPPSTGDGGVQAAEKNFSVASDTWTFVHNLGFVPAVGVYGTDGRGISGHVESNTRTTTVVTFYYPVAGRMNLS